MNQIRVFYYADICGETECNFDNNPDRTYKNITRSSKKRISALLATKALNQYAHVFPYIDLYVYFPP